MTERAALERGQNFVESRSKRPPLTHYVGAPPQGEPNRPLHHFVVPLPRKWEAKVASRLGAGDKFCAQTVL